MKKGLFSFLGLIVFFATLTIGIIVGSNVTEHRIKQQQAEEPMRILESSGFRITLSIDEGVIDEDGKEEIVDTIEQFSMELADAVNRYRANEDVSHIKLLRFRIRGNKEAEALLMKLIGSELQPRLSDKD